jgi:hypothetical protein
MKWAFCPKLAPRVVETVTPFPSLYEACGLDPPSCMICDTGIVLLKAETLSWI